MRLLGLALVVLAVTPAASMAKNNAAAVDGHTKAYMKTMAFCFTAASIVLNAAKNSANVTEFADTAVQGRDLCESVRSRLASKNTDHFDDQAATGFYAVDRVKSGLNALLAYIDNPRPTKLIEARNKIQDGSASGKQAYHDINVRRHHYGLRAYKP